MNATLALPDPEFLAAFEECRLPDGFPHRAHVRLAWLEVRRHGAGTAAARVAAGIRRLAEAEGAPGQFHATITCAWVYLVAAAVHRCSGNDFDAFVAASPELLDKSLLARHYSPARLEQGRSAWLPPDLEPITGAPPASAAPGEPVSFLDVMRLIPTAVAVVTAHDGSLVHGSTVSSVTALSREPELVLACLAARSRLLALIRSAGAFSISFLAEGQGEIAARFADPQRSAGAAQFRGVPHRGGAAGPVLTEAAAWLECDLHGEHPGGDHAIVIGRVVTAGVEPRHPLLRRNGAWVGG